MGKNIKKIRTNKKLNQEEFAKMIGISRTYLSDLENDRKSPSIDTVNKIADSLHISSVFLLSDSDLDIFNLSDISAMTSDEYSILHDKTFFNEFKTSLSVLNSKKTSAKEVQLLLASINLIINNVPKTVIDDLEIILSAIADLNSDIPGAKQSVSEFSYETLDAMNNLKIYFESKI